MSHDVMMGVLRILKVSNVNSQQPATTLLLHSETVRNWYFEFTVMLILGFTPVFFIFVRDSFKCLESSEKHQCPYARIIILRKSI
jgi:hypothetical protein